MVRSLVAFNPHKIPVGMLSLAGSGACKSFLKVYAAAILGPSWVVSHNGSSLV